MQLINTNKNSWFSVVLAVFLVWFMLILTTWTFNLIFTELNDNRWAWSYLNAFAWAEWAQELALLKIKEKSYWYDDEIQHNINDRSIVLSQNSTDISKFNWNKDVFISYSLNTKTGSYDWEIAPLWYDIIPLFYFEKDTSNEKKALSPTITLISWIQDDLAWNIVWTWAWISWSWVFNPATLWSRKDVEDSWPLKKFSFSQISINSFLNQSSENYLILFNWNETDTLKYSLKVPTWEYFTRPNTEITSSAQVWKYRQNLRTKFDNTEFLNILKYSIFSN